ncbi:hypothetical protein J7J90_01165 [Candidatus Micrarchaeota archaeon]|nr:hypothetical protein [Candidatus Micrarchaeota archaeon]
MAEITDLIFKVKVAKMLVNLKEKEMNISSLARASGCTYVYATKILHKLMDLGIVDIKKERKYQVVSLTENGGMIATHIIEIFRRAESKPEVKEGNDTKN